MSLCFPEKKQKQVKEKKENNNKISYFYSFVNRSFKEIISVSKSTCTNNIGGIS